MIDVVAVRQLSYYFGKNISSFKNSLIVSQLKYTKDLTQALAR